MEAIPTLGPIHHRLFPSSILTRLVVIMGRCGAPPQVWCLDSPPIVAHPNSHEPLPVISDCGTYIATRYVGNGTVSIANLLSPTPTQFIDTDMDIWAFALTGNVLLVWDRCELVAWWLTEKGIVDGVSADRRANRGGGIWTVLLDNPRFSVEDQIVVVKDGGSNFFHVYHAGTGELLEPAKTSPDPHVRQYEARQMEHCQHYLRYRNLHEQSIPSESEWPVTRITLEEGWVKDLEGKHRMWVPVEWRVGLDNAGWLRNTTLLLYPYGPTVIVMF